MVVEIGSTHTIGWDSAKILGDENIAFSLVRVEAKGADWIVFRHEDNRKPYAVSFEYPKELSEFLDTLNN